MKALILAGGKGARLKPFTLVLPKPLMPVGDFPILEIIIKQLKRNGVDEVVLAVGHMAQLFEAFFQDGRRLGIKIRYCYEDKPLGTAGAVAFALEYLGEDFIVMNGDLLTTLNYGDLFAQHLERRAAATIAIFRREIRIEFGVIESGPSQELLGYREKPVFSFDLGMGVNVLNRNVASRFLEKNVYLDLPDLMMRIRDSGEPVYCYRRDCFWLDIGNPADYEKATRAFEERLREFLPESADAGLGNPVAG